MNLTHDTNEGVYMETNNRLQRLRIAKGYTQKRLAKEAGLTERAIQNYEYTTRQPKGQYLSRLAAALDVPEEALLDDNECDKVCKEILSTQRKDNKKAIHMNAQIAGGVSLIAAGSGMILGLPIMIGTVFPLVSTFVASKWLNVMKKKEADKALLKEQCRINGILTELREETAQIKEKYKQLAIKTQQDNADIDEYEEFISVSKKMECIQEYRELLKEKAYDISLLINECKKSSSDNKEIMAQIVNKISELEEKEREITTQLKEIIK